MRSSGCQHGPECTLSSDNYLGPREIAKQRVGTYLCTGAKKRTSSEGEVRANGLGPVCFHWAFSKPYFRGEQVSRRNNIQGPINVQDWVRTLGVQQRSCLLCTLLFGFDSPPSPMVPQDPEIMIPANRNSTKLRETLVVVNTRKRLRAGTTLIRSSETPEIVPSTGIYPRPQEQAAWTLSPHSLVKGSVSSIHYRKAHCRRMQGHSDLHVNLGCLWTQPWSLLHFKYLDNP